MLTLDLRARFRNKTFIFAMLGAIALLIQQLGFKDLIPYNWSDIVNTALSILVMLGIVVVVTVELKGIEPIILPLIIRLKVPAEPVKICFVVTVRFPIPPEILEEVNEPFLKRMAFVLMV